jgi:hypothetical protein
MATTLSSTIYEVVDQGSPSGALICSATSHKVGFYGKAPVSRRPYSSAVHATSAQATSADFGATQLATLQEIMNTLIGLGVWATV